MRKSKELSKLIEDILEQLKTDLNEMSIEKVEMYSDDYFLDDPIRINQVINNLITNSIKYSKHNNIIEFWIDDEVDRIIINIKDYVCGISMDDIPFVFNKFYRGEKHRSTKNI